MPRILPLSLFLYLTAIATAAPLLASSVDIGTLTGGGTLEVNNETVNIGTITNAGNIIIGSGGTLVVRNHFSVPDGKSLTSNGTLVADVTVSGTITTGTSPGVFTIQGNLAITSSTILNFKLGNPSATVGDDRIDLMASPGSATLYGKLTLDGTANITNLGNLGIGNYPLMTYQGALTDNGLDLGTLPQGYVAFIQPSNGVVSLVVTAVPEPASMMAMGLGLLAALTRRSQRRK